MNIHGFVRIKHVFHRTRLILMNSNLSIFPFMDRAFGVKPENILPSPGSQRFSPIFF
jgi:hypothetical protein